MGDMRLEAVEKTAGLIAGAKRMVVFTGRGSARNRASPIFEAPVGSGSVSTPRNSRFTAFSRAPRRASSNGGFIASGLIVNAKPNQAHLAVAELENLGKLECVITQNIDNLHQKAGNSPEKSSSFTAP